MQSLDPRGPMTAGEARSERLVRRQTANSNRAATTGHEMPEDRNDGYEQEKVDKPSRHVEYAESEEPCQHENDRQSCKHDVFLCVNARYA